MAKRLAGSDEESPYAKRRKIGSIEANKEYTDDIQSLRDLQRLLAFEQDSGPQVKQSIFSPFL